MKEIIAWKVGENIHESKKEAIEEEQYLMIYEALNGIIDVMPGNCLSVGDFARTIMNNREVISDLLKKL